MTNEVTILRCAAGYFCSHKPFSMAAKAWHPITEGNGWICDECFKGMEKESEREEAHWEAYYSDAQD